MTIFFMIAGGVIVILLFVLIIKQKYDIEHKLQSVLNEQGKDFFQKIDFIFNRIAHSKDETQKQTIQALDPINKVVENLRAKIEDFEKNRIGLEHHYKASLTGTLENLMKMQNSLLLETSGLKSATNKVVQALKKPNIRGKWGEIQLKRIAELSGMLPFCDFDLQSSAFEGIRPDMVVKLPNGGFLFVDAKAPLDACLQSLDGDSEQDDELFRKNNLKAIKNHIYSLGNKQYWAKGRSPELVVMFIPLESIWIYALEEDPKLIEYAAAQNIVVATPMTLIALMKAVSVGWNHVYFAEEAESIKKSLLKMEEYIKVISKSMIEIDKNNQIIESNTKTVLNNIRSVENIIIDTKISNSNYAKKSLSIEESSENIEKENTFVELDTKENILSIDQIVTNSEATNESNIDSDQFQKVNINYTDVMEMLKKTR